MIQLTAQGLATLALLCARGCEPEHLNTAWSWLAHRPIPPTPALAVVDIDEAITLARSLDATA